jgi:hypothetical protein
MVLAALGATVHTMIGRRASSFIASALVAVHLLVGAFAEAAPVTGDVDCTGGSSAGVAMETGAAGHSPMAAHSNHDSSGTSHHVRTHVVCRCGCAHTPALSAARPLVGRLAPSLAVCGTLIAAAFDPPLFDFLRPPN